MANVPFSPSLYLVEWHENSTLSSYHELIPKFNPGNKISLRFDFHFRMLSMRQENLKKAVRKIVLLLNPFSVNVNF